MRDKPLTKTQVARYDLIAIVFAVLACAFSLFGVLWGGFYWLAPILISFGVAEFYHQKTRLLNIRQETNLEHLAQTYPVAYKAFKSEILSQSRSFTKGDLACFRRHVRGISPAPIVCYRGVRGVACLCPFKAHCSVNSNIDNK